MMVWKDIKTFRFALSDGKLAGESILFKPKIHDAYQIKWKIFWRNQKVRILPEYMKIG